MKSSPDKNTIPAYSLVLEPNIEGIILSPAVLFIAPSVNFSRPDVLSPDKLFSFLKIYDAKLMPFKGKLALLHGGGVFLDYFQFLAELLGQETDAKEAKEKALSLEKKWTENNQKVLSEFKSVEVIYSSELMTTSEYHKAKAVVSKLREATEYNKAFNDYRGEFIQRRYAADAKKIMGNTRLLSYLDAFLVNVATIYVICQKQGFKHYLHTHFSNANKDLLNLTLQHETLQLQAIHSYRIKFLRRKINMPRLQSPWETQQQEEIKLQITDLEAKKFFSFPKIEQILILQCLQSPEFYLLLYQNFRQLNSRLHTLKTLVPKEKDKFFQNEKTQRILRLLPPVSKEEMIDFLIRYIEKSGNYLYRLLLIQPYVYHQLEPFIRLGVIYELIHTLKLNLFYACPTTTTVEKERKMLIEMRVEIETAPFARPGIPDLLRYTLFFIKKLSERQQTEEKQALKECSDGQTLKLE